MRRLAFSFASLSVAILAFASCDDSTSSPSTDPSSVQLPALHAGSDVDMELVDGAVASFAVPTTPGYAYAITTAGTTDTKLLLVDAEGDTIVSDLRPDSTNGLIRWSAGSSSSVILKISGKGRTTIRFVQVDGADSTEPDNTLGTATLARLGAAPTWRTLTPSDTDWVKFPVESGKYYRITAQSDSAILLQSRSKSGAWNSETPMSNVVHSTVDTFVYVRIRKAGKTGSAGYSLRVDTDSTTFAHTEPNARGKETVLTVGAPWISLYLDSGMSDFVKFDCDSGTSYRMEVKGNLPLSTDLAAADSYGSDRASGFNFVVLKAVHKGSLFGYIQKSFGSTNPVAGEFQIRVAKDTANRDSYESDDTRVLAKLLLPGTASAQKHYLTPFEEDWVKFRVDSGRSYQVIANTDADFIIRLYSDSASTSEADISSTELAGYKSKSTGYAFAAIISDRGEGAYTLSLSVDSTTDVAEPDDSRSNAYPYGGSDIRRHMGCGDIDWTSFSVDSGKSYVVSASASGNDAAFQTMIYCGDSEEAIEYGWSSNYRTDEAEFTAPSTGTCYVKIIGSSEWSRGDYYLTIK